jgi:hypothetical protein
MLGPDASRGARGPHGSAIAGRADWVKRVEVPDSVARLRAEFSSAGAFVR